MPKAFPHVQPGSADRDAISLPFPLKIRPLFTGGPSTRRSHACNQAVKALALGSIAKRAAQAQGPTPVTIGQEADGHLIASQPSGLRNPEKRTAVDDSSFTSGATLFGGADGPRLEVVRQLLFRLYKQVGRAVMVGPTDGVYALRLKVDPAKRQCHLARVLPFTSRRDGLTYSLPAVEWWRTPPATPESRSPQDPDQRQDVLHSRHPLAVH